MLIGLTGKNAAGKTTVAQILKKKGFYYYSLSDVIRDELLEERKELSRSNMIAKGNVLRKEYGGGALARLIKKKLELDKNYCIDSIRAIEEVEELKKEKGFHLIAVTSGQKVRFDRMIKRKRKGDATTFNEFKKQEVQESIGKKGQQNLNKCEKLSEYNLKNNGTLKQLEKEIDAILEKIPQTFERPAWDTYFMNIAKVVASRSNCVKRKVAAVIVKDKRIISTGYNGTPRNTKNCNEGGCKRCNSFTASGTNLSECVCSHGEENAIVQASYHGASLKDATIYTTFCPCLTCSKMIINSGIKTVVFNQDYPLNDVAQNLLKEAKIKLEKVKI